MFCWGVVLTEKPRSDFGSVWQTCVLAVFGCVFAEERSYFGFIKGRRSNRGRLGGKGRELFVDFFVY